MPNLVGIGLSQVPTNSMLGGMAYQDPEHASIKDLDLKNLSQINSEIADTAVDVFVYDTSKDSDGGAWRKRTTHTSWYNETLGTATRGTRREFPAVAVIVAEGTQLTIYDGDDPDLPMWMVFNLSGAVGVSCNMLPRGGGSQLSDITSVAFLNSKLVVGLKDVDGNVGEGPVEINFISDFGRVYREVGSGYTGAIYDLPISGRNSNSAYNGDYNSLGIVAQTVNDVAMTVLPNAPIDSATGLPVPTIVVGTASGTSVIKDDGTVADYTGFSPSEKVAIDSKYVYSATRSGTNDYIFKTTFNSADASYDANITAGSGGWYANSVNNGSETPTLKNMTLTDVAITKDSSIIRSGNDGIEVFDGNVTTIDANEAIMPFAYITSDYNTGYMHGDIKGAFLSDTTVESLTANTNLATSATANGNNRLTSETYDNGDTSWQVVDNAGSSNGYIKIEFTNLVVGQSYFISMTWDNNATLDSGYTHKIQHQDGTASENFTEFLHWNKTNGSAETLTGLFTAQTTNNENLVMYCNAITLNVSNFNVRAVDDEDRSVNNNGLAVYGTITKSAVATGAEVVGYGPFSSSNVLSQPYNSDLTFGTNDFSVIFWMNNSGTNIHQSLIGRDNREFAVDILDNTNYSRAFRIYSNNSSNSLQLMDSNTNPFPINTWSQICVNYTGGNTATVYVNGVFNKTGTLNYDIDDTSHGLNIGARNTSGSYAHGASGTQLALVRVSASAPSAEQIKKMYEDEKVLFQENAKATLYGSSDAVTALAYDEVTDLLHVGTSAGRSDFQGLRRINNTTTAVTTAISAHDEFIIEQ